MANEALKVYICGVDWEHEIKDVPITIYPSVRALKKDRTCYHECGIVELEVKVKKWVQEQDFSFKKKEKQNG